MRRWSLTEEGNTMFLLSPPSGDAVRRPIGDTEGGWERIEHHG